MLDTTRDTAVRFGFEPTLYLRSEMLADGFRPPLPTPRSVPVLPWTKGWHRQWCLTIHASGDALEKTCATSVSLNQTLTASVAHPRSRLLAFSMTSRAV